MAENTGKKLQWVAIGNLLKKLQINRRAALLDIALLLTAILLIFTNTLVPFFHMLFVLLIFGAFYWRLHAFALRAGFWVVVTIVAVLVKLFARETHGEELIEVLFLTVILVLVFVIARQRARAERALQKANEELENRVTERTAELRRVNAELVYEITRHRQTEKTLQKLSSVVEQTADIVFITNKEGVIEYVNPAFERDVGYTKDEAIGQTPRILKSGQYGPRFYEELWKTILSGRFFRAVVVNKKKSGELYYEEKTITPLRDNQGNITHFVSTGKDITERKRAEEVLRESETKFRILAETTAAGIFIFQNAQHRYVNPAAEIITGYTQAELMGMHYWEMIHPDFQELFQRRELARQRGEKVPSRYTVKILTKDGEGRWIDFSAGLIEFNGAPALLGTAFDITEHKRAETERERLLAAEREQRIMAETLGEVFLALAAQTSHRTVLDEILRQVRRIVSYSAANIMLLEDDTLYVARHQGYHAFGSREKVSNLEQSLVDFPLDARVVQYRQPLIVPDTHQNPDWVTVPESAWIRSFVAVPICLGEHVMGLLRLDSDILNQFSTQDVERLQPLAGAAAIALNNARLYDQARREIVQQVAQAETDIIKLDHQLRTLQYAGATIASSFDLHQVLHTIPKEMASLMKVEGCAIFKWDQRADTISVIARYGLHRCWEEGTLLEAYPLAEFPLAKRVLTERRPQQLTSSLSSVYPADWADLQQAKIKTLLMVPMEFRDQVVGLVKIMDVQVERMFTNRGIGLAQLLANQIASAIENTRLYEQLRQEINERTQAEKDLRHIAAKNQAILDAIPDSIFLFNRDGQLLDYKLHEGSFISEVLSGMSLGRTLDNMQWMPPDLVNLFSYYIGKTLDSGTMQIFEYQLRVPQDTRDFEVWLVISSPKNEVLAIVREVTERKAREAALANERARIARDLHDTLSQSLSYLRLKLDEFTVNNVLHDVGDVRQELVQMRDVTNEAYELLRSMLATSRPSNSTNLATALLAQARSEGNRARFKAQLTAEGQPRPLSSVTQHHLLYIFREALANVAKHANAQQVDINLLWAENTLTITLSDDGCGFNTHAPRAGGHFGLEIMQERAEEINGFLSLTSTPGVGTTLTLQLPVVSASPPSGLLSDRNDPPPNATL